MPAKLLTKAILKSLPRIGATDGQGDEAIVRAKLFTVFADWAWYVIEFDPETRNAYGLVEGFETELGYFNVDELATINLPGTIRFGHRSKAGAITVERDIYFLPRTLGVVRAEIVRRKAWRA